MTKYDIRKDRKALYSGKAGDIILLETPSQTFLACDGAGNPNTVPAYAEAVQALYTSAYTLKFASKAAGQDFTVPPLEGLWWADDWSAYTERRKDEWSWTMLIAVPPFVAPGMAEAAITAAKEKKGFPALDRVRVETIEEGRCAQVMHVGSYDDEAPLLARLHQEFLPAHGLRERGKHHEVYLSDPRRTAPEKLKTVLRQPVE